MKISKAQLKSIIKEVIEEAYSWKKEDVIASTVLNGDTEVTIINEDPSSYVTEVSFNLVNNKKFILSVTAKELLEFLKKNESKF